MNNKKTKIWSQGDGHWKLWVSDWELWKILRKDLKINNQKRSKNKPGIYYKGGDQIAWDIVLDKTEIEKAKKIIKKHK